MLGGLGGSPFQHASLGFTPFDRMTPGGMMGLSGGLGGDDGGLPAFEHVPSDASVPDSKAFGVSPATGQGQRPHSFADQNLPDPSLQIPVGVEVAVEFPGG